MENLIYSKQFRFTIAGQHLNKDFTKSVFLDIHNRKITLDILQIIRPEIVLPAIYWIDKGINGKNEFDEKLDLIVYDAVGNEIFRYELLGLTLIGHTVSFDVGSAQESYDKVTVKFRELVISQGKSYVE
jgi:hypothetical protein